MPLQSQPAAARGLLSADAPPYWTASALAGVKHGFFGREGGVSTGIYASLNAGTGSNDDAQAVAENRRRIAASFGADALIGVHQVHSPDAVFVAAPWSGERPHADALVTTKPGLVISVLTADCAPVLLADRQAGVVAAAHAGWKGAIGGVLEATVRLMREHGAQNIAAAIGPTIHQSSYEVGSEFEARFVSENADYARFFAPGPSGRAHFDLPAFCAGRLAALGISAEILPHDTYANPQRWHSCRRAAHRGEGDYGRDCAAIAL
jgi:YfiH family protein